ncbi:hypothetical protein EVAR_44048_1 [Eumeta japonica]|uniref:Uncharacterized protein n=1 Tax=Eumeta variegata TaxID=151549 RepID=A0A4C1XL96_EUMVA|nr:hypothetical protein EVAR_44048_1 [Eumeta japonica]
MQTFFPLLSITKYQTSVRTIVESCLSVRRSAAKECEQAWAREGGGVDVFGITRNRRVFPFHRPPDAHPEFFVIGNSDITNYYYTTTKALD